MILNFCHSSVGLFMHIIEGMPNEFVGALSIKAGASFHAATI